MFLISLRFSFNWLVIQILNDSHVFLATYVHHNLTTKIQPAKNTNNKTIPVY